MIIKSIRIQNLRSIVDQTIALEPLTALVGANGSGKSSVLCAFEIFYEELPALSADDFFNLATANPITISVTYAKLSAQASDSFKDYLEAGNLTVERVIKWENGKSSSRLHGFRMQHASFAALREVVSAAEKKELYSELRAQSLYSTLSPWRNLSQAAEELSAWEKTHPDQCSRRRDDGQFFNFRKGGNGDLHKFSRPVFIPAVRSVTSDAVEGRGAVITTLLDMVVRTELAKRPEIAAIQTSTLNQYKALLSEADLKAVAEKLGMTLRTYAPTTSVRLVWQPIDQIQMPTPKAAVRIVEDEFETSAERTGHGVQRALILTLLQRLAVAQSEMAPLEQGVQAPEQPSLLLAIEEPELYQHPNRQRHLSAIFRNLASAGIPGVSQKTQILYTTHSPQLVGLDRFNQVRICRKVRKDASQPKESIVESTTLDIVAQELWKVNGSVGAQYTGESLAARLKVLMTTVIGEGFFADVVVLVEGETDQAAIVAAANLLGHDLATLGVSVIPCRGKSSLDRPALVFRKLGIPTYLVWDGDYERKDARPHENRRLLRLLGKTEEDWPAGQDASCTIFKRNLERTLREELGPADYDRWVNEALADTGLTKDQGLKNPTVFEKVLVSASKAGKKSATLNGIVLNAVAMKT